MSGNTDLIAHAAKACGLTAREVRRHLDGKNIGLPPKDALRLNKALRRTGGAQDEPKLEPTRHHLYELTNEELRELGAEAGLTFKSRATKAEMVEALR